MQRDKLHWYSEVMCYKVTGLYPPRLEDTNHEVLFTRAKKHKSMPRARVIDNRGRVRVISQGWKADAGVLLDCQHYN